MVVENEVLVWANTDDAPDRRTAHVSRGLARPLGPAAALLAEHTRPSRARGPNHRYGLNLKIRVKFKDTILPVWLEVEAKMAELESVLRTKLVDAAYNGQLIFVEYMLANGADIDQVGQDKTALMAAALGNHKTVVSFLLKKGADVKCTNSRGRTALHMAYAASAAVVQLLLDRGAQVSLRDKEGVTPLMRAAHGGKKDIVRLLLHHNARVNCARNDGSTPLHYAASSGHKTILRMLIEAGADVNHASNAGATALFRAMKVDGPGQKATVRLLINSGANVNHVANNGMTPTMLAIRTCKEDVLRMLLNSGGDVNYMDHSGAFALHIAATKGDATLVELLLRSGADADAKDNFVQDTALNFARHFKNTLCVAALQPRTIACLRPWTIKTTGAFPRPFRRAIAVLLRQVSRQTPPAIAPDPSREAPFNLGRTRGVPMCPVTDAATGETRDLDLLQELILTNGLIDCDWFSLNPKTRLRTWLLRERRLALRQWQAGDTVLVQGLLSKPEINGRVVVVQRYLRKKRRFICVLENKRLALRQANLEAPRCGSCGKCGAALRGACPAAFYCGTSCQKAAKAETERGT